VEPMGVEPTASRVRF